MSSILKVDTIQDQDGNNIINENANTVTVGKSGDTVNIVGTLQNNGAAIPGDISSVVAGTGLSGGGTTGDVTLNIEAAQPTITSTGTLTTFSSTGIDDNATSTAITINSSENVGIGTASPSSQLHIENSSTEATAKLKTTASDTGVTFTLDGNKTSNGGISSIVFSNNGDSVGMIRSNRASANDAADMLFYTQATGGANSERMRIDSSGNVGIGTSAPSEKLEVHGTEASGGVEILLVNEGDGGISTTPYTSIKSLLNSVRDGGEIRFGRDSNYGSAGTADSNLQFYTALDSTNTERMRIDSSGNVGIGTTSPTAMLELFKAGTTQIKNAYSSTKYSLFGRTGGNYYWSAYEGGANLIFSTSASDNATTEAMRIDSSGHVTKPLQPAVQAYMTGTQSNIATGVVTVQLNAEIYDVNSDFNTGTYTFTAPVTGKYLVTMNLVMTDVDTAFQWIYLLGVSSNRNYYLDQIDPRMLVQDGVWSWSASSLVDMDANDTFIMKTRSSAHGAAQMDIAGGTAVSTETTMTITLLS